MNTICPRSLHKKNFVYLGLEIIDFPKNIFEAVTRPYEFAFRINKVGKYTVKYRYKLQDRFGNFGYINYIMYVEVVDSSW